MKKLICYTLLLFVCSGMTSCGGDDHENGFGNESLLIGSWAWVKEVWVEDGEQGSDVGGSSVEDIICFNEDGTGYEGELHSGSLTYIWPFEYKFSGNTLIIKYDDEDEYYMVNVIKLTSTQLVLREEYGEDYYDSYYVRF